MNRIYCMVIGDIVNSKKINSSERARIQRQLKTTLEKINFDYYLHICSRFSITLGDELQGGLYSLYPLFEILESIKKSIYPYMIRFGIGIDTMRTDIHYIDSLSSDGLAYYNARESLESLKKTKTTHYGYRFSSSFYDMSLVNNTISLCECISKKWTETQIKYIELFQQNPKMELVTIAKRLNVNVSSVSRGFASTNYKLINDALKSIKNTLFNAIFASENNSQFWAAYNRCCMLINEQSYKEALEIWLDKDWTLLISGNDLRDYYAIRALLSNLLNEPEDSKEAISFAEKALEYMHKEDKCHKIKMLNVLGVCYSNINKYENAKKNFNEAIELMKNDEGIESWYAYTIGNKARMFMCESRYYGKEGNVEEKKCAIKNAEQGFNEVEKLLNTELFNNDAKTIITLYGLQARMYFENEEYRKSLETFEKAYRLAEQVYEKSAKKFAYLKYNFAELLIFLLDKPDYENILGQYDVLFVYEMLKDVESAFKKIQTTKSENLRSCYDKLIQLETKHGEQIRVLQYEQKKNKLEVKKNG